MLLVSEDIAFSALYEGFVQSIIKLISSGIQLKTKIVLSSHVSLKVLYDLERLINMILYLSSIRFVQSSSLFCTRKTMIQAL